MTSNNAPKITGTDPDASTGKKSKGMRPLYPVDKSSMTVADYLSDESVNQSARSYRWAAANVHRIRPTGASSPGVRMQVTLSDALVTVAKSGVTVETRGGSRSLTHSGILSGETLANALAYLDPVEGYQVGGSVSDEDIIDLEDLD